MSDAKPVTPAAGDIVVDVGKSSISDLWKKEDYWAIWLGFLALIATTQPFRISHLLSLLKASRMPLER